MTSSGRELLKWVALVVMTGDHVAKLVFGGYVPIVSELGRVAFPVFALVMAYNLAQPGADVLKSLRRLALWGVIAQPVHALAFGGLLPLNVLLSFALAAAAILSVRRRWWWLLAVCVGPAPLLVDYQWSGVALVLASWFWFRNHGGRRWYWLLGSWDWSRARLYAVLPIWIWFALVMLCLYNGNAWALLALPIIALSDLRVSVPRAGRAFYGYYVGHFVVLAGFRHLNPSVVYALESFAVNAAFACL